jgi:hypothetical protein
MWTIFTFDHTIYRIRTRFKHNQTLATTFNIPYSTLGDTGYSHFHYDCDLLDIDNNSELKAFPFPVPNL